MAVTLTGLGDFAALGFDDIIDVRSPSEFAEDRLPGAINLPLDRIVAASAKVSSTVEEIAAASSEQANGIDEMSQTVSHMDEITQQNAALAEESAASARVLLDQIEQLNRLVAAFRTDQGVTSGSPGAARRRAA